MKFINKLLVFMIFLVSPLIAGEKEEWRREVPKNDAENSRLIDDNTKLRQKIAEEERKENPTEEDKAILDKDREIYKYNDATITIFEQEQAIARDPGSKDAREELASAKKARDDADKEIVTIENYIAKEFHSSNGGNVTPGQPGFFEKILLSVKQWHKERQYKSAIDKALNKDYNPETIITLQKQLNEIYTKLGDKNSLERLNEMHLKYRPEFVKDHLLVYERMYSISPDETTKTLIKNYIRKYINSLEKAELINDLNFADPTKFSNTISDILGTFGISKGDQTQLKITQLLKEKAEQIAADAKKGTVQEEIKNFFDKKSVFDEYEKQRNAIIDTLEKYIPIKNFAALEKSEVQPLIDKLDAFRSYIEYVPESINPIYRSRLLSFLDREYTQLARTYKDLLRTKRPNSLSDLNRLFKQIKRFEEHASEARAALKKHLEETFIKFGNTIRVKDEIEKNNNARPLSKEGIIAATNALLNAGTLGTKMTDIEGNPEILTSADFKNSFNQFTSYVDGFIKESAQSDATQEAVNYATTIENHLVDLGDLFFDIGKAKAAEKVAGGQGLSPAEQESLANFIATLDKKAFQVRHQSTQDFKDLLRGLNDGNVFSLLKSFRNTPIEQPSPALQQLESDAEKGITDEEISIPEPVVFSLLSAQ